MIADISARMGIPWRDAMAMSWATFTVYWAASIERGLGPEKPDLRPLDEAELSGFLDGLVSMTERGVLGG